MLVAWKYRPRNTIIQRLDPRVRLGFIACIILAITISNIWDIRLLLPPFILTLILFFLARIEWHDIRRAVTFVLILLSVIVTVNALVGGRGGPTAVLNETSPVLYQTPALILPLVGWKLQITITVVKVVFWFTQLTRMLTMAFLAIPIPYTFDPSMYGTTFKQMGLPDKAAFTMDLAFRFVPTLARDFNVTVDAQRARGYEVEGKRGGIFNRLRRVAPLLVPVTMQSIVTGEEVIDALDLRAFGVEKRTWLRHLKLAPRDYAFLGLGILILIFYLWLRTQGLGDFWVPEFMYHLAGQ